MPSHCCAVGCSEEGHSQRELRAQARSANKGMNDGICSNPEVELSEVESSSSPAILPTYESNEETMPLNFPEQLSKSSDDGLFKNDQFGMSAAGSMFGDESDMVADSMLLNDCHVADMDQVSELVTEYEYEIGELQVKNETLNDKVKGLEEEEALVLRAELDAVKSDLEQ
uniref:Uncharacterized protein n=1 Tax=Amphimedon queenslandica TaxID=400682 RepID=A0A1X7VWV2_AMPQE